VNTKQLVITGPAERAALSVRTPGRYRAIRSAVVHPGGYRLAILPEAIPGF